MSSAEWDRRYAVSELVWTAEPNRFVAAEVADLPAGRALDLGCGEGRNAVWLAEHGWRVTGVDFSRVALDKARRLAESRGVEVDWVGADVLAYPAEPAVFDLVLVAYLQLSADERRRVVRAAAAALAPGARCWSSRTIWPIWTAVWVARRTPACCTRPRRSWPN